MNPKPLLFEVPKGLAELLEAELGAVPARKTRSSSLDLVLRGAEASAVLIAIAQGPNTVADLARLIKTWIDGKEEPGHVEVLSPDQLRSYVISMEESELIELQEMIRAIMGDQL